MHTDPRTASFYARRALELAASWAFKHDTGSSSLCGQGEKAGTGRLKERGPWIYVMAES